ncbi:MAG: hypothetical protein NVSMB42_25060 [Herpetosiphon sp.]
MVDHSGNLFVADSFGHRVLRFSAPLKTGQAADLVLGQANFTNRVVNRGNDAPSAATLSNPTDVTVDRSGNLFVADSSNHRVLRYTMPFSNGQDADLVLGQTNFTSGQANRGNSTPSAATLFDPDGVAFDRSGNLFVAEYYNHRVIRYSVPSQNGQNADLVLGQPDFISRQINRGSTTPSAATLRFPLKVAFDNSGNLFVVDSGNQRVLEYDAIT